MTELDFGGVGERIAFYRKMNQMSGDDLVSAAGNGVTRSVLANIETGRKKDVTLTQLFAIAAGLQIPPAALLFDAHRPDQASGIDLPGVDAMTHGMAARWAGGQDPAFETEHWPEARRHLAKIRRAETALDNSLSVARRKRNRIAHLIDSLNEPEHSEALRRAIAFEEETLSQAEWIRDKAITDLIELGVTSDWDTFVANGMIHGDDQGV